MGRELVAQLLVPISGRISAAKVNVIKDRTSKMYSRYLIVDAQGAMQVQ